MDKQRSHRNTGKTDSLNFAGINQPYRLRNGDYAVIHDCGTWFCRGQRLSDGCAQIWDSNGNAETPDGESDPDRDLMALARPATDEHSRLQPAVVRLRAAWAAQQENET